jgi:hypothetical protein
MADGPSRELYSASYERGAVQRLLGDRPKAKGLAVPGMPVGSPGMEGGTSERYDVILFGPMGRRTYMSFVADRNV